MATVHQQTTRVYRERDPYDEYTNDRSVGGQYLAARVIWFVAGVIITLLAFRFVLALAGANPVNGFADFIYTTSQPLVAPFFGLFSYNYIYGVASLEVYTLVAMLVYVVIAYGLAYLVTIDRR